MFPSVSPSVTATAGGQVAASFDDTAERPVSTPTGTLLIGILVLAFFSAAVAMAYWMRSIAGAKSSDSLREPIYAQQVNAIPYEGRPSETIMQAYRSAAATITQGAVIPPRKLENNMTAETIQLRTPLAVLSQHMKPKPTHRQRTRAIQLWRDRVRSDNNVSQVPETNGESCQM
jgi:hypothetical protein